MGRASSGLVGVMAVAGLLATATIGTLAAAEPSRAGRDVAESTKDAEGYSAALVVGKYKAGEKGAFTVTLKPKDGFHINAQFPARFKATAVEGITYDKAVLKREDGKFTETAGTFTVELTAAKPGNYTVGGTLSLSVCNEKNCLMEKVPLDATITVD
ncbi:MAG: hypothetical protein U0414_34580 [Polyangiaceae bacterium]